ncbi:MAG: DUF3365 domain-containing protein [Pseudomonadota bacterium]
MPRMKKIVIASGFLAFATLGIATAGIQEDSLVQARGIVKNFFTALKGELEAAMKSGGPVTAIAVCHTRAPQIAKDFTQSTGWTVGRTSLKLRHAKNQPDAWETQVLQQFESRRQAGEDLQTMEFSEVLTHGDKQEFRYMKAIPTAELCLGCHGMEIKPEVQAALKQLYPEDHATGFKVGDLRGAFTLRAFLKDARMTP